MHNIKLDLEEMHSDINQPVGLDDRGIEWKRPLLHGVRTGSGVHFGHRELSLPGGNPPGREAATHHLVSRIGMIGAMPPFLHTSSWRSV
jgi:hypothetical protein